MTGYLEVFESGEHLVRAAVDRIARNLHEATERRGIASIVLSGGTTPRSIYELLAMPDYSRRVDWSRVHFFWGDERCVPRFSPESNFRMASEALLSKIAVPEQNVHHIFTDLPANEAAARYEDEIRALFKLDEAQWPEFDVFLLGLGEDGHTASIFPDSHALNETRRLFIDVYVEKLQSHRITVTLPVINNAMHVIFIVSGKSKSLILHKVLETSVIQYPAHLVDPRSRDLCWMVDADAASHLETARRQ